MGYFLHIHKDIKFNGLEMTVKTMLQNIHFTFYMNVHDPSIMSLYGVENLCLGIDFKH